MEWYYAKNGRQLGPVDHAGLVRRIAAGEVAPTDLVWRDGMADWTPAGQIPELSVAPAAGATEMSASEQGAVDPASPYAPPAVGWSPPNPELVMIPNYLWQSILVTVLCCWPFGIPAIVYAAKVDGLKARGDIAGARAASEKAKQWCLISVGGFVLAIILVVAGGGL